jgi:hypothetical protein
MHRCPAIVVGTLTIALVRPAVAKAVPPIDDSEAALLARAFAPTLVFHPDEHYFPVSPLFPIDLHRQMREDGVTVAELRTPDERLRAYGALSRQEQIAEAALEYRVFASGAGERHRVAVEYWCHYVFNDYVFHGGLLGWSAADNHHDDLERVVFELERVLDDRQPVTSVESARRVYAIRRIVASAHDGSITANVLDVDANHPVRPPVAILVEKGSHAMAPDVDDDGRVTPGRDVNAGSKFVWGIRDHGDGGVRYRSAFADDRTRGVRLCGADLRRADDHCQPYALLPGEELQHWFLGPALTPSARDHVVGRTSPAVRWFGDVNVEELLIPRDPAAGDVITSMIHRRASRESGMSIGVTLGEQGERSLLLGGRWAWIIPGRLTPDVLITADGLADTHGIAGIEAGAMAFYQLDLVTKAMAGITWEPRRPPGDPNWDLALGAEVRAGRLRIRPRATLRKGLRGTQVLLVF